MKMTDDEMAAGAAMMLLRQHGEALAPVRVAERIGELALAGDIGGVRLWKRIAARMDQILRPGFMQ